MMLAAGKGIVKALADEKPHTAVSGWVDALCTNKYEEDDYTGIPELVEVINIQATGPTEASRAVRKKLKYSDTHGRLRALTILQACVINCGTRFQTTFANERLVDRLKVMAGDPMTDPAVKKKLMIVLLSWYREFKDDPKMQLVAKLYVSCGGGKDARASAAKEAYDAQQARYENEARERSDRKMAERSAREEKERAEKEAKARAKQQKGRAKRPPFNFEAEKPKIMSTVAVAAQSAQNLINALQRVNREKESVETNQLVQERLTKAKADRKAVVRYITLVETDAEGDYIGTLLSTNEQILAALALYDQMIKPPELDSDDEDVKAAKEATLRSGLKIPAGAAPADDDDTASIRSRLSAFAMRDREVDKLQYKQRARVQRAVSQRNVHPDLQDLSFAGGAAGGSLLDGPLARPRAPAGQQDTYERGSLSEYSSYDSESSDGEVVASGSGQAGTSAARSYAAYVQQDTRGGKGLLDEDDEDDDPFGDDNAVDEVNTPGIHDRRMGWKEV